MPDTQQIEAIYSKLSATEKARLLIGVMQELAVIGREAYMAGEVGRPDLLRKINEIQQHLTGFARDAMDEKPTPSDADVASYVAARFAELGKPKSLERVLVIAARRAGSA